MNEWEPLARGISKRLLRPGMEIEDLMQEALIAAWLAIQAWKPGGFSLKNFIAMRMKGRIIDSQCRDDALAYALPRRRKQLRPFYKSLNQPASAESEMTAQDLLEGSENPERDVEQAQLLAHLLKQLSERQRAVVDALLEEKTMREIAVSMGLSPARVHQIYTEALTVMRNAAHD